MVVKEEKVGCVYFDGGRRGDNCSGGGEGGVGGSDVVDEKNMVVCQFLSYSSWAYNLTSRWKLFGKY